MMIHLILLFNAKQEKDDELTITTSFSNHEILLDQGVHGSDGYSCSEQPFNSKRKQKIKKISTDSMVNNKGLIL